jgi:Protein of unknown function (DUF1684)
MPHRKPTTIFVLCCYHRRHRRRGKETYGGGRFLEVDMPVNGKTILDFNTASDPYCAYDPDAHCPMPLKENRLALPIRAGQKKSNGKHLSTETVIRLRPCVSGGKIGRLPQNPGGLDSANPNHTISCEGNGGCASDRSHSGPPRLERSHTVIHATPPTNTRAPSEPNPLGHFGIRRSLSGIGMNH